jgi:hypothetical protein
MAAWKNLHDILHNLDNAFDLVYNEAFRLATTLPDLSPLFAPWDVCATHLAELTEFARSGAQRIVEQPFERRNGQLSGDPWVVELLVAQRDLDDSLKEGSVRTVLRNVRQFRHAIHTHLNASDKALADESQILRKYTRTMARLLPRTEQGQEDTKRAQAFNQLRATFNEIQTMQDRLYVLLEQHDLLQDLYNDFTMVRDKARGAPNTWDLLDLEDAWLFCKSDVLDSRLIPFVKRSGQLREEAGALSGEAWAVDIVRLARELDDHLEEEALQALPGAIRQFGNTARQHFFVTDKLLKDITSQLNEAASVLLKVLEAS